ncbi:hypothetical protein [Streptomyces sp. NPDC055105]|uniref:hypothetical protein n=1 Tax=Streptomyces sp. NPDC055105 TaxID=3365719 RepID=UPI0037D4226A
MTITVEDLAVEGRRIELTYYRDLNDPAQPAHPGIITGVNADKASLWIRLDGTRCNLAARTDFEGLRYLDEVVPVPALPMGRFTPERSDTNGFYEKDGVLLAAIGKDREDLIVIAEGREKAIAVARAYLDDQAWVDLDYVDFDNIRAHWAVFEWEPEGAESPWTVRWDAAEGDDQAVRIHYLPA